MYTLSMVVNNIRHKSWWWNGATSYTFDTVENLIKFIREKKIPTGEGNIKMIYKQDKIKSVGTLVFTNWYKVVKGNPEHQMTEYTSF